MKSYTYGIPGGCVHVEDINYSVIEFEFFGAREVLIGREPKGEYHVKINDSSSMGAALEFFKYFFSECEVDLIDVDNLLKLEYNIYIKVKDEMQKHWIMGRFEEADEKLRSGWKS